MQRERLYRRQPRLIEAVARQWMVEQGFFQAEAWGKLGSALRSALPAAWGGHVQICRIAGGQVTVAVDSAALLAELQSFHASRLRTAFREAAPRQGVRKVKFILSDTLAGGAPADPV